jgi:S1-C subfamily serine protease
MKWKRPSARCSVNSETDAPPPRAFRGLILGGALLVAAFGGAFFARTFSPSKNHSAERPARPIVQIVRQQPGLPDLADLIDRLCPSVAIIVAHGLNAPSSTIVAVPASAFSADGWLVTSAGHLPQAQLDAVFGDGRRVELSDLRVDPVSGLAIVKATDAPAAPLSFSDQAFPRVGQFGFGLTTPAGTGCSADAAMIGSDFLADGGGPAGYVRLQPPPSGWSAGTPLFASDGRLLGIGTGDPAGAVIPAPVASVIIEELIRSSLSPSTSFGFRAIDYAAAFAARLGDVRSGAGVSLVQPKSSASRAGLQAGDIVIAVDEVPVSSASELSRALDAEPNKATITVQRRSQQLRLTIKRTSS